MTPQISIIIPNHNQASALPRTLRALASQTVKPDCYEVIVVADGCQDETVSVVKTLEATLPYHFQLIEQTGKGKAAARNRGAAEAKSPLLLFLDADQEAAPQLIGSHLAAHLAEPGQIYLGNFTLDSPPEHATSLLEVEVKRRQQKYLKGRQQPGHRFTLFDVNAANFSISRDIFQELGGFDERFQTSGDYEFGVRALQNRLRLHLVADAVSFQHGSPDLEAELALARSEGSCNVLLAQKHPEVINRLRVSHEPYTRLRRTLRKWLWSQPVLSWLTLRSLTKGLKLTESLGLAKYWSKLFELLRDYYFWLGVKDVLWTEFYWKRLLEAARERWPDFKEMEIDLATELPRLTEIIESQPLDGLWLRYGSYFLGHLKPISGTEALRPIHVREFLGDSLIMTKLGKATLENLQNQVQLATKTAGRKR